MDAGHHRIDFLPRILAPATVQCVCSGFFQRMELLLERFDPSGFLGSNPVDFDGRGNCSSA